MELMISIVSHIGMGCEEEIQLLKNTDMFTRWTDVRKMLSRL